MGFINKIIRISSSLTVGLLFVSSAVFIVGLYFVNYELIFLSLMGLGFFAINSYFDKRLKIKMKEISNKNESEE